jgi:hypothetical protein
VNQPTAFRAVAPVLLLTLLVALGGCGAVGTMDIGNARASYNEIIRQTDDQQLLAMIVHTRYGDSFGFLSVASVTSNLSVSSTVGANFGIGPSSSYAGNLVPLSAGMTFEENPTISYVPRQGQEYARAILAPVPLDILVLLAGAVDSPTWVLTACIARANQLRNGPSEAEATRFHRACELTGSLIASGDVMFTRVKGSPESFALSFCNIQPSQRSAIEELFGLLGLDPAMADRPTIEVPISLALGQATRDRLDVVTRSPYDLLRLAARGVVIPDEHVAAGLVRHDPERVPPGAEPPVRVLSSRQRPSLASVSIQYRGWWFYVADDDPASKQGFLLLRSLVLSRLQQDASASAPTLTIPLGG